MTRSQRKAHAAIFPVLALGLVLALGWALVRRQVVASTEAAPLGHARAHDAHPVEGAP